MSDETKSEGHEVREGERIAKVMARAGVCSRRDAEAWIAEGRVTVNGNVLVSPAFNVSEADDVRVDGKPLAERERTRLFLFYKPRGLVTTARDPEGRPTVFEALPPGLPRLVAVGRLDINTEGLLLLTNDGGLARVLELPATGWLRRYRVRAHGTVDQATLDRLISGITIDGVDYLGIEARLDREQGANAWITVGLREGKNREIKKVLDHLGLAVNRLIRVSFGPFELGELADGEVAEVRTRVLRDQLGAKLAREAGADFDAPLIVRDSLPAEPRERERRHAPPSPPSQPSERRPFRRPLTGEGPGVRDTRGGPPRPSMPERKRKHVSALRAEIAADAAGPRRRVERGATHDRKGRTVAVERISLTGEKAPRRLASEKRAPRFRAAGKRGGRTFEPRERPPHPENGDRAPRAQFKPRRPSGEERDQRERRLGRRSETGHDERRDRALREGGSAGPRNTRKFERSHGGKHNRAGESRPARSDGGRGPRSDFKPGRPDFKPRDRKPDPPRDPRRDTGGEGKAARGRSLPGRFSRPPAKGPRTGKNRPDRTPRKP